MRNKYPDDEFIKICQNSKTMAEAAIKLNLHFNTFKSKAKKLNCYVPNQGGKGTIKPKAKKIDTDLILNGGYSQFQTFKLKKRLIEENILENKCDICGINSWNNIILKLELHHKDGNRFNHKLENLQLLCPNCHSQTSSFRGKNIKNEGLD